MAKMAKQRDLDLSRPVAVWKSQDLLDDEPAGSLTVILRTRGCRYNRCLMCGYASEGAPATEENLLAQFERAMQKFSSQDQMVKIYTSGSFLDPAEVPPQVREKILRALQERGVRRLVIESRPEYIVPSAVTECLSNIDTEFAIGLESSNDLVREKAIRKGFSWQDFVQASKTVHDLGGRIKAYILLKPPHLSEKEAVQDAVSSARMAANYAEILSLNLCNVQRGTYVERLWERGEFRPPWLWSALEVLKSAPGTIVCDPVGAGSRRGPHNCGRCDAAVADAIRKHALSQDRNLFEELECDCQVTWRKLQDLEERTFGSPIV
ncbi:MAG: archaeosine biosynthesis radical SAM protein RaSEA [Methanotrichaceae archaeon]|nr:archaeosine biosynthesis radical SAM protein RaSEA [Methanotrichaceae archaeon]